MRYLAHHARRGRWSTLLGVLGLGVLGSLAAWQFGPPTAGNPFLERPPYVSPYGPAQDAAAAADETDREVLVRLAGTPTAQWLTPEGAPLGEVGTRVAGTSAAARQAERTPVFVIYGIPGRDCEAGHSAGGLNEPQYLQWVAEIAIAAGRRSVVVLEPDALALADECGGVASRTALLAKAGRTLTSRGVVTYLDAGHGDWIEPEEMARRLVQAGVSRVRGFAVNVANYDFEADETAYASQVRAQLPEGAHFVVDTGRSGAGVGDTWCNPAGRALGPEPQAFDDSSGLDAWLWIKPPGESDGTCEGGPPAGEWWPTRAVELARNAGW